MNLFALTSAYDLVNPLAHSLQEFREQQQRLLDLVAPVADDVQRLFNFSTSQSPKDQYRFDALLSVAVDAGVEVLAASALPRLLAGRPRRSEVAHHLAAIPAFEGVMRPELRQQFLQYHLPLLPRRRYEAELLFGRAFFTAGPLLDADGNKAWGPSVLHPLFLFMSF